jgi:DNA mismatch repair protein MutS2
MDSKSQGTLELPKVLNRLASHAHFSASKDSARSILPSSDLEVVARRQSITAEGRTLLEENADLTIGGAHDVRSWVKDAELGAVLEPGQILLIKDTLLAARTNRRRLQERADLLPHLAQIAEGLQPPEGMIDSISQVLDERGEILDTASELLHSLRKQSKVARDRLTSKLQSMVSDSKVASMLQEPIVTQREGRYVLPLRAEFKGQFKSVVHDQSSSGATLFVEPLVAVDLNNRVRELELAERDEIRRILAHLSGRIGGERVRLDSSVEALASIDLALATARYANELDANPVRIGPKGDDDGQGGPARLRLLGARHPLLEATKVVPVDVVLEAGTHALVITGPNTGGKTVALKTTGLLAAMVQCGLQIPVEVGSEVPLFQDLLADIGDEQSIEQSLSTFSGHVANIVRILERADEHSLVLLDELGAGTDPQEGASLAMAILQELVERRCTCLIATHYPELKTFAHTNEGVVNASVQFDVESLEPTYDLLIGLPGRSNALAIAQRLGMPQDLLERARSHIAPGELEADDLLDEIRRQQEAADKARSEAEDLLTSVREQQAELKNRLAALGEERRNLIEAARNQANVEVEQVGEEIRSLRNQLALARQPLDAVESAAEAAEALQETLKKPPDRTASATEETVRQGDRVHVSRLGQQGVVAEVTDREAEVQLGKMRVRVDLDELEILREQDSDDSAGAKPGDGVRTPQARPPALELDVRGQTVEEALDELERRLDEALLSGSMQVHVIHGKGSGRLRQAIRQSLEQSEYVASFRAGERGEGGDGVTVIELAV